MPITDPTWIFFIVLSIILFAPMLLERLHIPSIVGMIFAGILIGPHGVGLLERDGSFELFGKVGLYYIMFLASLEMNLQDVKRIQNRALTLGLLSFAIPMLMGYAANRLVLGFEVAAAVLTAAMYASHTLVSYPIVLRYGLSRLPAVSIAVGGTIVADTLTLLVLAVVGGMFKENVSGWYWLLLVGKVIVLGAVIIYAFPRVGRWFFRRYDESVVQYVFVLVLVFLGAGMMELVGMEGILGAFLVGIVLNRLIPPSSPLMSHIEFVGNALFIPYFLIGVGMIINLNALVDHEGALVVAAVMVVVGLLSKWLAGWTTGLLFKMRGDDRQLMFGLTSSRAAATLAVVLVGHKIILPDGSRLLGDDVLNGAMVLIVATCVVSSLLTERTARRLVVKRRTQPTEREVAWQEHILIALHNPHTVSSLMHLALMLRRPGSASPLIALNVVLEGDPTARQAGLEQLHKAEKIASATHIKLQTYSRWSVNVVSGISHTVKENAVTDLVVGLHQKERLIEAFFGKIATDLLTAVERQVFIFRANFPLNTMRRLHLLVPRKAQFEPGFSRWVDRVALLAQQLSSPVCFYSSRDTLEAIDTYWRTTGKEADMTIHEYVSWADMLPLAHEVKQDEMVVFVCARRGTISFSPYIDRLPTGVERYFSARNVLFVYPAQTTSETNASATIRAGLPLKVR